ncbi:DUF3828 domain-containing protein [Rahnella sp. CJA17(1/100)]|uniref:DUF3828 domain-containing protein n=1 Tax=Rahnella sp. CJA17(1/100) TaxID=2508951 RepID=UPI00106F5239|nr:DUF3828 domain-containing protein [Rahnella sp. CJA17(1/100)]
MFTKSICCGFFLFLLTFNVNASVAKTLPPDEVTTNFYHSYLVASDFELAESIKQSDAAVDLYTTKHLQKLKSLDESGSDYFTYSQDFCPDWASNIKSSQPIYKGNTSYVIVTLGLDSNQSKFRVDLVKDGEVWKMQSVNFISRQSPYCN